MGTNDETIQAYASKLEGLLPNSASYASIYGLCYLAYKMQDYAITELRRPEEWLRAASVDRRLWDFLVFLLDSVDTGALNRCAQEIPHDALKEILLLPIGAYLQNAKRRVTVPTPALISELAIGILDIQPGERVAELRCGDGSFLADAAQKMPNASYSGSDIDEGNVFCTLMRADVAGVEVTASREDTISWLANSGCASVDKAFLNHPLGQILSNAEVSDDAVAEALKDLPKLDRRTSALWVYSKLCIDALTEQGRAVAFLPVSVAQGKRDLAFRRAFVDNGWIEAAVMLPKDVFWPYSSVNTVLLVLSKNNDEIKLVDATDLGFCDRQGWRIPNYDEQSRQIASQILNRVEHDGEHSTLLSQAEVRDSGYSLWLGEAPQIIPREKMRAMGRARKQEDD